MHSRTGMTKLEIMKRLLVIVCLAATLTLGAWRAGLAQDTMRAAAVVNDEVISMLDLAMRTRLAIVAIGAEDTPETRNRILPQVLRALIDERLQLQEAGRLAVEVPDEQIEAAMKQLAGQNQMSVERFEQVLAANGIHPQVVRQQVRARLTWDQVIAQRLRPQIDVSSAEVDSALRQLEREEGALQRRVAEIFLVVDNPRDEPQVRENAEQLVQELRSGANFQALAREFSQSATASVGGDLGWIREGQLEESLENALAEINPGQLIGPIRGIAGYYILFLIEQRRTAAGSARVALRQALVGIPPEPSASDLAAAEARIEAVRENARSCADLAQAAEDFEDVTTAETGMQPISGLPPDIVRAVAELPVGEESVVVRRRNGLAVIMVCDRETSGGIDRAQVEDSLTRERLDMMARRYMRDLRRDANVDIRI